MIFRRMTSNLVSICFQIFHFATVWAENILARHTSTTSSVSQAIQQLYQDWDISQGRYLLNAEEHVTGDALAVSREVELDLLIPDASIADSGN